MKKFISIFTLFLLLSGTAYTAPAPQLLTSITDALTGLVTGITGTVSTILVTAINITTGLLSTTLSTVATLLNTTSTAITSILGTTLNLTAALVTTAGNLTATIINLKVSLVSTLLNTTLSLTSTVLNAKVSLINTLLNATASLLSFNTTILGDALTSIVNITAEILNSQINLVTTVLSTSLDLVNTLVNTTSSLLTTLATTATTTLSTLLNNITTLVTDVGTLLISTTTSLLAAVTGILEILTSIGISLATVLSSLSAALTGILGDCPEADAITDALAAYNALVADIRVRMHAEIAASPSASTLKAALSEQTQNDIANAIKLALDIFNGLVNLYNVVITQATRPFNNYVSVLYGVNDSTALESVIADVYAILSRLYINQNAVINTMLGNIEHTVEHASEILSSAVINITEQNVNNINSIQNAAANALADKVVGPVLDSAFAALSNGTSGLQSVLGNLATQVMGTVRSTLNSAKSIVFAAEESIAVTSNSAAANITARIEAGNVMNADCVATSLSALGASILSAYTGLDKCIQSASDALLSPVSSLGGLMQISESNMGNNIQGVLKCLQSGGTQTDITNCLNIVQNNINGDATSANSAMSILLGETSSLAVSAVPALNSCISASLSLLQSSNAETLINLSACLG